MFEALLFIYLAVVIVGFGIVTLMLILMAMDNILFKIGRWLEKGRED